MDLCNTVCGYTCMHHDAIHASDTVLRKVNQDFLGTLRDIYEFCSTMYHAVITCGHRHTLSSILDNVCL